MRSDAKLGMALGMLVIGFAVAFCFPREGRVSVLEQVVEQQIKQQKNSQSNEIEFVPIRDLRNESNSSDVLPQEMFVPTVVEDQSDSLTTEVDSLKQDSSALVDASQSLKSVFQKENGNDPISSKDKSEVQHVSQDKPEGSYIVQQGDTLSEISMKTLGSHRRYLEIFEANRDQLESPDDLRLGMKLSIPIKQDDQEVGKIMVAEDDEVLPTMLDGSSTEQPGGDSKRFSSPQRAPFLTDRTHKIPVHQIPSHYATTHTVQAGDTLEKIAVRYFGTVRAIRQIRMANPDLVQNSRSLQPGVVLHLVP